MEECCPQSLDIFFFTQIILDKINQPLLGNKKLSQKVEKQDLQCVDINHYFAVSSMSLSSREEYISTSSSSSAVSASSLSVVILPRLELKSTDSVSETSFIRASIEAIDGLGDAGFDRDLPRF